MQKNGIVCFLDVYGYSAEAKGNYAESAAERLFGMWKEIGQSLSANDIVVFTAFSDSIFLGFDSCAKQPSELFESEVIPTIQCIMGKAAEYGYLLRGSAAYGSFLIHENIVGGDAVIQAHKFETVVRMPVFHVPRSEITKINNASDIQLPFTFQEIGTRNGGLLEAVLLIPHPVDDYISHIKEKLEEAFDENNYEVAKALREALSVSEY